MIQENSKSGYLELAHTADWALKVWAPDLVRLFIEAAAGMYMLMEVQLENESRSSVPLDLQAFDDESLLVAFLGELLYLGEEQRLAFDEFDIALIDDRLVGMLHGARVRSQRKEIKAVTYHELQIERSDNRLEVVVVFDV
jgi:SHS2 domain-containing protein